jgi:hypothetical protein
MQCFILPLNRLTSLPFLPYLLLFSPYVLTSNPCRFFSQQLCLDAQYPVPFNVGAAVHSALAFNHSFTAALKSPPPFYNVSSQWRTEEFFRGWGVQQIQLRTEKRERASGGGSLLIMGSAQFANE